jgi:predicted ribonuclease toxin of YeeF-YezG toxin-antitoxin module
MFKDSVKLTGRLLIQKYNDKNEKVYETEVPNLVVTSGKEFIASRIVGEDFDAMDYMAIGDDAQIGALSQTTLVNELARVTVTSATASGSNVTFTATFPAGTGTGSIVEAGVFNKDDSSVLIFDADTDVDDTSHEISYTSHGLVTGDKITYTDGGGTAISGLTDGGTYYVIRIDANTLQLATSAANATAGTEIGITSGIGSNHKITYGTMLCRTTFPVITKSSSETIAISWVVTVG